MDSCEYLDCVSSDAFDKKTDDIRGLLSNICFGVHTAE